MKTFLVLLSLVFSLYSGVVFAEDSTASSTTPALNPPATSSPTEPPSTSTSDSTATSMAATASTDNSTATRWKQLQQDTKLKPILEYRGIWYVPKFNTVEGRNSNHFYHMQADFGVEATNEQVPWFYSKILWGYTPSADMFGTDNINRFLAREYYVGKKSERYVFQLGLQQKSFGLENWDHTSLQKTLLEFGTNPYSYGLLVADKKLLDDISSLKNILLQWMYFDGNPFEDKSFQYKGFIANMIYSEWLGLSLLSEENEFNKKKAAAIFTKMNLSKVLDINFEHGTVWNSTNVLGDSSSSYSFLKFIYHSTLEYAFIIERQNMGFSEATPNQWRWILEGEYSYNNHLSLTTQLINKSEYLSGKTFGNDWTFQEILHLQF